MGILVITLFHVGNTYLAHHLQGYFLGLLFILCDMESGSLVDLIADGVHGGKGYHGLLENHGYFLAPNGTDFRAPLVQREQIHLAQALRIKHDLTAGNAFFFIDSQNRLTGKGFSAAGFAYQAQRFTFFHLKVYAPDRGQKPFCHMNVNMEIFDLKNIFTVHFCSHPRALARIK